MDWRRFGGQIHRIDRLRLTADDNISQLDARISFIIITVWLLFDYRRYHLYSTERRFLLTDGD